MPRGPPKSGRAASSACSPSTDDASSTTDSPLPRRQVAARPVDHPAPRAPPYLHRAFRRRGFCPAAEGPQLRRGLQRPRRGRGEPVPRRAGPWRGTAPGPGAYPVCPGRVRSQLRGNVRSARARAADGYPKLARFRYRSCVRRTYRVPLNLDQIRYRTCTGLAQLPRHADRDNRTPAGRGDREPRRPGADGASRPAEHAALRRSALRPFHSQHQGPPQRNRQVVPTRTGRRPAPGSGGVPQGADRHGGPLWVPCPLYDRLYRHWHRLERNALADGARDRIECLWLNDAARSGLAQLDIFHDTKEPA